MKSILSLCAQDFKRLLTNALFWVLTVTLVLIVLVVNFALPGEITQENHRVVTYNMAGDVANSEVMDSEDALREVVRNGDAIGLIGKPDGIVVVHPNLSKKMLDAAMLVLSGIAPEEVTVTSIGKSVEPIPYNKRMTPIFICFEALITGFILGGALMLAEKEEATVKALRISPLSVFQYLMAKTLLFSAIGTAYAVLICAFCVGFGVAWLPFVAFAFFGTAVYTLIGLAYTTLFKDMSGWFFSMTLLLSVNMLPVISYSSPSFAPVWIKLIPSYPLLFSFEQTMFGGSGGNGLTAVVTVASWCVVSYLIAHVMTKKLFLKGA